ncbi:hypothetical protein JXO59_04365 [candidate division KSB1 bacterium]|nr:hypothetical protein [candidate division KSB1 bacterium]
MNFIVNRDNFAYFFIDEDVDAPDSIECHCIGMASIQLQRSGLSDMPQSTNGGSAATGTLPLPPADTIWCVE